MNAPHGKKYHRETNKGSSSAVSDTWIPLEINQNSSGICVNYCLGNEPKGPTLNPVSARANNPRHWRYMALQESLHIMATLPKSHRFYLDPAAAARAADFLGVISKNLDVDAPRLFPQEGEAAVFTWDFGTIKSYLSVDSEDLDIMYLNKKTLIRCEHELSNTDENEFGELIREFGGRSLAYSISLEGDV